MLTRLLLVVDLVLLVVAGALGTELYRLWTAVPPPKAARGQTTPPPAPTGIGAGQAALPPAAQVTAFAVVAERNLFNSNRTENPPEPPKPASAAGAGSTPSPPPGPKPRLYGVIIGPTAGARAYLEDPRTRKVFGYAVGDSVADSQLEGIQADRVVLKRGAETYEVLLRDPSKPRPAAVAVPTPSGATFTPGVPGQPTMGVPGPGGVPVFPGGQPPPDAQAVPGPTFLPPGTPSPAQPGVVPSGPRRPPVRSPGAIRNQPVTPPAPPGDDG